MRLTSGKEKEKTAKDTSPNRMGQKRTAFPSSLLLRILRKENLCSLCSIANEKGKRGGGEYETVHDVKPGRRKDL